MFDIKLKMDKYQSLRDVVYLTVRQAILTGELKPGERLMELHLSHELGVSRTPIRGAMRRLKDEGLVVVIPRKGAHVAQITEKHLSDVLEVRGVLEQRAVAWACEYITKDELSRLKKACIEFAIATKKKDMAAIAKADEAFHSIIYKATQNDTLVILLNNLSEQMYRYRFEYIKDIKEYEVLVKEHKDIYLALAKQDPQGAAEAIKIHIDNQAIGIFRILDE
ncbi:GntR family transcriptional regulator [bacterium C-53]|nr:GntR family transcriptional regulator [Lachnospiraceae bacterium]NBI03607.1 GntR family transcriptional regulator [Lachnospiraceae bacterium]RKJ09375.1 GntR family transcriptional regulator [bacterium C-53]